MCHTTWLLVLLCMSRACGGPINQTQTLETKASTPVGGTPSSDTQNVTSPAPVVDSTTLNPTQQASAETLAELQQNTAIQEGDILMPEDRNAVQTVWFNATVPYTITRDVADRESDILKAFQMISNSTCIRFKPHTTEFNYLEFRLGKGCASFVGCRGGVQPIYLSDSCSVGNLCHEIIHALGLHHEHTRMDRDRFITVQWQNILPGNKKNFEVKRGNTLNLPYDLGSIMHYGQYFFSHDGHPTVLAKQGGEEMGQRSHLTQLDIQKLNRLYCADGGRSRL